MTPVKVTLCLGSSCHSRGNRTHVEALREEFAAQEAWVEISGSLCLGRCSEGPVVLIDGELIPLGPQDDLAALVRSRLDALKP